MSDVSKFTGFWQYEAGQGMGGIYIMCKNIMMLASCCKRYFNRLNLEFIDRIQAPVRWGSVHLIDLMPGKRQL